MSMKQEVAGLVPSMMVLSTAHRSFHTGVFVIRIMYQRYKLPYSNICRCISECILKEFK